MSIQMTIKIGFVVIAAAIFLGVGLTAQASHEPPLSEEHQVIYDKGWNNALYNILMNCNRWPITNLILTIPNQEPADFTCSVRNVKESKEQVIKERLTRVI